MGVLVVALSVVALAIPGTAHGQETERAPHLGWLLEDSDGDYVPERVGRTLTVRGTVASDPLRARSEDAADLFFVTIQDELGGVRLLTTDPSLFEGVAIGTAVEATGVLTHRRGSEELRITDVAIVGDRAVEPADALVRDALGEELMHRLVRVEGTLEDFDFSKQSGLLRDRTGAIEVRITSRHWEEPGLRKKLSRGGTFSVVGIVQQADLEPPFSAGYRLMPRDPSDLSWPYQPPVLQILGALLFLTMAAGLGSFGMQRRKALRRNRELAALATELAASRARLAESAAEYRSLFEEDSVARFAIDEAGVLVRWNSGLGRFLGRPGSEIEGRTLAEVGLDVHVDEALPLGRTEGSREQVEIRRCDENGQDIVGLMTLTAVPTPKGVVTRGSIVDVTEMKRLESHLVRTQKMDAIGRLAGGIAHDVNNMLSTILGNVELMQLDDHVPATFGEPLDEVRCAALRSARLTRQLLTTTRRDVSRRTPLALDRAAEDMLPMLKRLVGSDVELVLLLGEASPVISGDLAQIEQIFLNLVTNARDALPDGGKIVIETHVRPGTDGAPPRAVLRFTDTGIGIPEVARDNLFEPFFTTKLGGTGLGLSTVYGIVGACDGTIECSSTEGHGTVFELTFPTLPEAPVTERAVPPAAAGDRLDHVILLVDDEPSVRSLARRMLERAGATIVEAQNGDEALRTFREDPERFDAIVTDLVMPILGGAELARSALELRGDIPVIFMSGYVDVASARREVSRGRFVRKPFRTAELVGAVAEAVAAVATG